MSPLIDIKRVAELQQVLGADFGEIVDGLVERIASAIEQIGSALNAGQLDAAARAAHAARNDALIVQVKELMRGLEDVEQAARAGQLESARGALTRVRSAWPQARDELQQLRNQ